MKFYTIACVLAFVQFLIATLAMQDKSPTFDEPAHLSAGYNFWINGDYRQGTDSSVFSQKWAALPLLMFSDLSFPTEDYRESIHFNGFATGIPFLVGDNNPTAAMLMASRAMIAILAALTGLLVFHWARSVMGAAAGLFAQLLFITSPMVLANAALVTTDMVVTFWFVAASYTFWQMLERVTLESVAIAGLCAGALVTSKFSCLIFGPLAVVLLGIKLFGKSEVCWSFRAKGGALVSVKQKAIALVPACAVAGLLAIAFIWAIYDFRYARADGVADVASMDIFPVEMQSPPEGAPAAIIDFMREYHLLPQSYLLDLTRLFSVSGPRYSFLWGEITLGGQWYFFPFAFVAKNTLPFLLALLLALGVIWHRQRQPVNSVNPHWKMPEMLPWLVFIVLFTGVAITSSLNIGYRHFLPVVPFICMFGGAATGWLWRTSKGRVVLGILCGWLAIDAAVAFPNYIAYINPILGGNARNYEVLVDSSTDWGQELPAIKEALDTWQAQTEDDTPVYMAWFGSIPPQTYGIEARQLPSFFEHGQLNNYPLEPGIYLISNTMLQNPYTMLRDPWNPNYEYYYQRMFQAGAAERSRDQTPVTSEADQGQVKLWNTLRYLRLTDYLKKRGADAHVNYGVRAYFLTAEDLHDALVAPRFSAEEMAVTLAPAVEEAAPNAADGEVE